MDQFTRLISRPFHAAAVAPFRIAAIPKEFEQRCAPLRQLDADLRREWREERQADLPDLPDGVPQLLTGAPMSAASSRPGLTDSVLYGDDTKLPEADRGAFADVQPLDGGEKRP